MAKDRGPNVRFPPPLLFLAGFLAGIWLDASVKPVGVLPGSAAPLGAQIAGLVLVVAGVSFAAWAAMTFRFAGTPVVPMYPATTIVTHGPFKYSRNPMYVGMTVAYLGLALALNTLWPVLLLPLVLLALLKLVIHREERHLGERFGEDYQAYRRRVRRWL